MKKQLDARLNNCKLKEDDKALLRVCNIKENEKFQSCILFIQSDTSKNSVFAKQDDAQALINLLGIKLEARYPAAILSLLVLGLLMYVRRARGKVLRSSTKILKALQQLDQPT